MPAVGDIRNRLMALADQSMPGVPEIFKLFVHRLPKNGTHDGLRQELESIAEGEHPLVRSIPDPMRTIILVDFHRFLNAMPRNFDLRGASIGNLVLTAEYLSNRRRMDSAISVFSKLARVCGVVLPTVDTNLHLAARLVDDRVVVGQHLLTGKESGPLTSPIRNIWLTGSLNDTGQVEAPVGPATSKRIAQADLICYPPGSFYSSIVANLLPQGVGRAVADNPCPKVFVPNTTHDPEVLDLSVADQARVLCRTLRQGGAPGERTGLNAVIIDSEKGVYPNGIDQAAIRRMNLEIIDCPLITDKSAPPDRRRQTDGNAAVPGLTRSTLLLKEWSESGAVRTRQRLSTRHGKASQTARHPKPPAAGNAKKKGPAKRTLFLAFRRPYYLMKSISW